MSPVDRRDAYRAEIDRAVGDYGVKGFGWTRIQVARAQRICYRTVWAECDWLLYANRSVEGSIDILPNDGYPDHGGDKNSVGLYQQRSPWWWTEGDRSSLAAAMDPHHSTIAFLKVMERNTPAWLITDESDVCQRTQGSQYDGITIDPATGKPFVFAQNYRDRQAQVDAVAADLRYFTNQGS